MASYAWICLDKNLTHDSRSFKINLPVETEETVGQKRGIVAWRRPLDALYYGSGTLFCRVDMVGNLSTSETGCLETDLAIPKWTLGGSQLLVKHAFKLVSNMRKSLRLDEDFEKEILDSVCSQHPRMVIKVVVESALLDTTTGQPRRPNVRVNDLVNFFTTLSETPTRLFSAREYYELLYTGMSFIRYPNTDNNKSLSLTYTEVDRQLHDDLRSLHCKRLAQRAKNRGKRLTGV